MRTACIIGVSGFGLVHYQDLIRESEEGRLKPLGATIINQDEEAEKVARLRELGCAIYDDHRVMLDELRGQVDICQIPTGIHLHAPMTIDALRAGANVFVEKPAAATYQDVRAMRAAAEQAGRFVAVGYQWIYADSVRRIKQLLVEGRIGRLRSVRGYGLWRRSDAYYGRNRWAGKLKLGEHWVLDSPFNNALAHLLNVMCFWAGSRFDHAAELRTISAELYRGNPIESTDTASLRIETVDGVEVVMVVTHCSEAEEGPEVIIEGEAGSLRWSPKDGARLFDAGGAEIERVDNDLGYGEAMRRTLWKRVHERFDDDNALVCDLGIAGTQTLAVNGAHDSSSVHPVPEDLLERRPLRDSTMTVIRGIDEQVRQCWREGKLFSEIGVDWAEPGREILLTGYESFPQ